MRVVLLSYAEVLPDALASWRRAAAARPVELVEVEPHLLRLHLPDRAAPRVLVGSDVLRADAVVHRTVQPYRSLVQPVLEVLAAQGTVVLNDVGRALLSRSKVRTLLRLAELGLPTVPTTAVAGPLSALDVRDLGADLVLKPSSGAQGRDVRRIPARELGDGREPGPWSASDGPTLVQPLVRSPFDLRAYVVGGTCVALGQRWHAPGDWRCNVALGGTVTPVDDDVLRARAEQLAVAAVDGLGLDHAAVDLLVDDGQPLLSEVDAWGGFVGLEGGLGVDVAGRVLDLAASRTHA
ncbi:MAG: Ribosomal protein modification protein [Frankiales bacterium]|nr:Ribosomal protein modification protein [Frankiales bacterium]